MHVTICVVTRDRGDTICVLLRSILALEYNDWDVVIVDQSPEDSTKTAVLHLVVADQRFLYLRSSSVGSSAARNIAIAHASGPILAWTDDDCEVAPDWLDRAVPCFRTGPHVGLLYGHVRAGPHDPRSGFIPDYPIRRFTRIDSPWLKWREGGIGANMVFRQEALRAVGLFDEILGSGAPLHANLDGDMTYRMLKAGFAVLNVPDVVVVHHGYRDWTVGRPMMRRVGIGVAATYMKYLRLGDTAILPTLFIDWFRCVSWRRLLLLQGRSGMGWFLGYGLGMLLSFRYAIDREKKVYVPSDGAVLTRRAAAATLGSRLRYASFFAGMPVPDADRHAPDTGALFDDAGSYYDQGISLLSWFPLGGALLAALSFMLAIFIRRCRRTGRS